MRLINVLRKNESLMSGIIRLWCLWCRLYTPCLTGGRRWWRTWLWSFMIALKSPMSLFSQIISNAGWFGGRKPCLTALDTTDCNRSNPSEPISPHHAGDAYVNLAKRVKTWEQCVKDDMKLFGLHSEWVIFRDVWRDLIWGKRLTLA